MPFSNLDRFGECKLTPGKNTLHVTTGIVTQVILKDDPSYPEMEELALEKVRSVGQNYFVETVPGAANLESEIEDDDEDCDRGIYRDHRFLPEVEDVEQPGHDAVDLPIHETTQNNELICQRRIPRPRSFKQNVPVEEDFFVGNLRIKRKVLHNLDIILQPVIPGHLMNIKLINLAWVL